MTEPKAYTDLRNNLKEVSCLLAIHEDKTGREPGRRFGVAVLNKSAIVLITACWEAFVEDLAKEAFDFLLANANDWNDIPVKIRVAAAQSLRNDKDERRVWDFAGSGWHTVLRSYKASLIETFNTPKAGKIDELYKNLLDIPRLSDYWSWQGLSDACVRLDRFVTLRGDIAHRVSTVKAVTKKDAKDYRGFVRNLAVKSSNSIRHHIHGLIQQHPWAEI